MARTAEAVGAPLGADSVDQRTRILERALELMGEQGAQNTSMRQLAAACDLNVATLYHYFPSKAAILSAVIEDKRYVEQLAESQAPVDPALPPRQRLAALLRVLLEGMLAEEATLRLIIGEGLRGEQVAVDAVEGLSGAIEATVGQWLADHFPEMTTDPALVARLVRDQLLAFCVETLAGSARRSSTRAEERADDVATLVFPA